MFRQPGQNKDSVPRKFLISGPKRTLKKRKIQLFIPDFDNLRWYSFKILRLLKNFFSRVKMFCGTCSKTNSQTVPIHRQKYKIFPQGEIPTLTEKKSLQKSTENSVVHTHQITMVWHPFFLYYFETRLIMYQVA